MLDIVTNYSQIPTGSLLRVVDDKCAISVVGLGHVGTVTTACLSSMGHKVIGVDCDTNTVARIADGTSLNDENDLGLMLQDGVANEMVSATTDLTRAVMDTDVTFVSVGTPVDADGDCDYRNIQRTARAIGVGLAYKNDFHVVVMRSSVAPGASMGVMVPIIEEISGLKAGVDFGICFNPEFLREGLAVKDFFAPRKTVIGASDERSRRIVAKIYSDIDDAPIMTDVKTAEMIKHIDSVWPEEKVFYTDEIQWLCDLHDVDCTDVMDVFFDEANRQRLSLNKNPDAAYRAFNWYGSAQLADEYDFDLATAALPHPDQFATPYNGADVLRSNTGNVVNVAFNKDPFANKLFEIATAYHGDKPGDPANTQNTPLVEQKSFAELGALWMKLLENDLPDDFPDTFEDDMDDDLQLAMDINNTGFSTKSPAPERTAREASDTSFFDVLSFFSEAPQSQNHQATAW